MLWIDGDFSGLVPRLSPLAQVELLIVTGSATTTVPRPLKVTPRNRLAFCAKLLLETANRLLRYMYSN